MVRLVLDTSCGIRRPLVFFSSKQNSSTSAWPALQLLKLVGLLHAVKLIVELLRLAKVNLVNDVFFSFEATKPRFKI